MRSPPSATPIPNQGNTNEEVAVFRYVTAGSFDAYMWQALETKARFITQVMTAAVKAIASGNPAVLTLAEADAELQRLSVLRKNHADEQYTARRRIKELPSTIARLENLIRDLESDAAKPAAVGSKNFDTVLDLDASGNVTTRRPFGAGFGEPLA